MKKKKKKKNIPVDHNPPITAAIEPDFQTVQTIELVTKKHNMIEGSTRQTFNNLSPILLLECYLSAQHANIASPFTCPLPVHLHVQIIIKLLFN